MENELSCDEDIVEVPDKTKDKYWKEKKKLIKEIKELVGTVGSGKKPLNVLVLGTTGCGKSSFINTVLTSFREDQWKKYAIVGTCRTGGNITSVNQNFRSFRSDDRYYPEEPNVLLPTFIDINGLEDGHNGFNPIFLKLLFNGKIEEAEHITTLKDKFDNNEEEFERLITKRQEYLKIHRIIVVTSGNPDITLPKDLYTCIKKTSDEVKGIPIFGVMTKKDKFGEHAESKKRQEDFITSLGITKDSFKFIENYCPDVDQNLNYHRTVYPSIDVHVLLFMLQVINPKLNRDTALDVDGYYLQMTMEVLKFTCTLLQYIIWTLFLVFFSFEMFDDVGQNSLCTKYGKLSRELNSTLPIDYICNRQRRNVFFIYYGILLIALSLHVYLFPLFVRRLARASTYTWLIIMSVVFIPIAVLILRRTGN